MGFDLRSNRCAAWAELAFAAAVVRHPSDYRGFVELCVWINFLAAPLVIIILSLVGQCRLQMFVIAGQISALACSTIAALMPAVDAYIYLAINTRVAFPWVPPTATSHLAHVVQLRSNAPVIPLDSLEGIITFPSFHAALGVLFVWAFWRTPVVRWIAVGVNVANIAATPVSGGHYFVDALAGLLVAFGSIVTTKGIVTLIQRRIAERLSPQRRISC